jgi:hypothetical protein
VLVCHHTALPRPRGCRLYHEGRWIPNVDGPLRDILERELPRHRDIPTSQQDAKVQSLKTTATTTDKPDFFHKYPSGFNQDKSCKLTLDLIVSNNLQLNLVESALFQA